MATQALPLMNVFLNYLVDYDLLSKGKHYNKTMMSYTIWPQVEYIVE